MSKLHMGINMGHDRSVAVVRDGELVVAIEQERLDRIKHSVGLMHQAPGQMRRVQVPDECIRYCLDFLNVSMSQIDTITANMPGIDHAPEILRGKFPKEVADKVEVVDSHHLAHAYSAYWPSGFDEALVLVADASGRTFNDDIAWETESYTLYVARGGSLECLHSERVQAHLAQLSTLGFVYEYIARKAGFETRVNSGLSFPEAGKLMGLAAYGGPQENWERWLHPVDGSPRVSMSAYDIFLEVAALEKAYDDGEGKPYFRPWLVDLAYKVQKELEDALSHIVEIACEQTGLSKLCIAGGVGLNSVANYEILTRCGLDDIYVFPAAGDNGIAAGCAMWAYATLEGGTERPKLTSATLGKGYSAEEVDRAIERFDNLLVVEHLDHDAMVNRVASCLSRGNIVARFEGGCEYGPRALGHRSIMADPTFVRMKDVINARVKFREAFRPFAPFVPLERANEVFELETESPFMLLVAKIRESFHSVLPSITHEDGTGRVQTCTPEDNRFFYDLCQEIESFRAGPPVLLNTSFNVAGQPIVETPEEAIATFLKTDIDCLALEDRWIYRKNEPLKSYDSHVRELAHEAMPAGLTAGQASVRVLMDELDAAIFEEAESENWTLEEIQSLSSQGARYKETSRLYPASTFVGQLKTQLSSGVVLLLDPKEGSVVFDQAGVEQPQRLTLDEVQVVLAMQSSPDVIGEQLRLSLGLTPFELRQEVSRVAESVSRFGVSVHAEWVTRDVAEDTSLMPYASESTLDAFASPEFSAWHRLEAFHQRMARIGYTEQAIIELLGVESLQQIEPTHLHYYCEHKLPKTDLADLVRLFLLRSKLSIERFETIVGGEVLECLLSLGVLRYRDGLIDSTIDLFCSGGMLFATDHRYMLLEDDALDEDPVMYIGMDSHGLVQSAPREACERILDLCCGSGVQGLVGCRYSSEVVAVDLNPRAVRFARFNAQLNGVTNYDVRLGSLYEVVEGETFDVILANPPFVPSPEMGLKFRDGGANGEAILKKIIEGASAHLSEAGRVCIVTDLVDTPSYSEKLHSWWDAEDFEALVLTTADRDEILFSVPHCHAPFGQSLESYNAELSRWVNNYRAAGLEGVNFGYIFIWNQSAGGDASVTLRTIHNPSTGIHDQVSQWYEQRRLWHSAAGERQFLTLHPELRMRVEHAPGRGESVFEVLVKDNPFFTTYVVGEPIYRELEQISRTQPQLGSRLSYSDEGWIEDLHRKGILRLSPYRGYGDSEVAVKVERQSFCVEELATKTTPTCLSSYLS